MVAYIPILKMVLPYLAPLVQAAAPIFTKTSEKENPAENIQDKQISELQSAVHKNAESLQTLAAQLQQAIAAFDERESSDQNHFSNITAALNTAADQNSTLKNALEKSIQDIQVTKYISLTAIIVSLIAIGLRFFQN